MPVQPRLVRTPSAPVVAPVLDDAQRAAVEHRGGPLLVLAGPGTGKTTTIVEAVVSRVECGELEPDRVLVLTFSRRAAAELRDRIAGRLGRTIREPIARTFHSYAFGLLRAEAARNGEPAPRLLSGPEQDLVVRELLRGDAEAGAARWPERLRPALLTRGFARDLRDLLQRAVERGVAASDLISIGRRLGRDDWVAAGHFLRQYGQVSALREAASYDPAELISAAVALLRKDSAALRAVREQHAFVVVDEYQDTDPAQEELLALVAGSRDLLVVGDPDQSIYGFRGADLDGIRRFPDRFRAPDGSSARVLALQTCRRSGASLLAASRRVASRLSGAGAHRGLTAAAGLAPGQAEAHVLGSSGAQLGFIANRLREAHLRDGVPWSRMAVLVRGSALLAPLRRALQAAGVTVAVRAEEQPLVEIPIVRALLSVLQIATGRRDLAGPEGADLAYELLTGPLGGADPLALRRLRQELRRIELSAGGGRSSSTLLAVALEHPEELALLESRAARPANRVAKVLEAARQALTAGVEGVLWEVWRVSGLAARLSASALGGGPGAAAADRNLDAVVALFDAAARFADRLPKAGPSVFLDHLLGQEIPGDTLAPKAPSSDGVALMTAHAAKGLEWDVVVVAGVQEGAWPDFRVRGSLLGTQRLLDVLGGVELAAESAAVQALSARLAEERRLFYVAVTRARRLLVVTAVRGDDEQPSRFLDELMPPETDERPLARLPRGLDLSSVVAELRAVLTGEPTDARGEIRRRAAAAQLRRLAAAGVRGADPAQWYGLLPLSDERSLADDGETVRVSPSRLESFEKCGLRWMLESAGGKAADSAAQGIGTMIHALAQQAAEENLDAVALRARFEAAVQRVDVGAGWFAVKQRERAATMLEKLIGWLDSDNRKFVAAEQNFEVTLGRAVLAGQVDRLELDEQGHLVVVDFKTTKYPPPKADLPRHPQLGAYQLAITSGAFDHVAAGIRESGGAELVQLGGKQKSISVQQQDPLPAGVETWAHEMVSRVVEGMAGVTFEAAENNLCRVCPVRTSCPLQTEGRQVTP